MKVKLIITLAFALAFVAFLGIAIADEEAPALGIEGTYKLVSRDLPDGSKQEPPLVGGMYTLTAKHRNFNVWWSDAEGKVFSQSVISEYSLTDSTYTETRHYTATHDGPGGEPLVYDFEQKTETVPVSRNGCQISFQLPFDKAVVVLFDGNKLTATLESEFVDHWEKVE